MGGDGGLLRTSEAATLLGVSSTQTVINYAEAGLLRFIRTAGGHRRVERASVDELLAVLRIEEPAHRDATLVALVERNKRLGRENAANPGEG